MTVAELLEKLKGFDPNLTVLVNGYEGGFDDPTISAILEIDLNINDSDVYGKHEIHRKERNASVVSAIILQRSGR